MDETLSAAFHGKRVLVTGGLGFIGSNLAFRLVRMGARVVLVDSLIPEYGGNLFNIAGIEEMVTVNIADVRDEYSMDYLVRGQDYLFNLAGQTSHLDSMQNPYTDLEINCRAQLSILEACRKHNPEVKIVFASTRQLYGKPDYLPVDEEHPLRPVDVNGVNKMAGEWFHILYYNVYGLRTAALRLTNTYGPRMRVRDARQTFLGIWIRLAIEERTLRIYGDGSQLRDFSYVDDAVDALLLAMAREEANGRVYNLAGEAAVTLKELAGMVLEANGGGRCEIVPFPEDLKRIDIGHYYASSEKIRTDLGWEPRVPLREGLARTLGFFREHAARYWEPE